MQRNSSRAICFQRAQSSARYRARSCVRRALIVGGAVMSQMFCHMCDFVDAIAVPIFVHKNDLRRIAPLWVAKCARPLPVFPLLASALMCTVSTLFERWGIAPASVGSQRNAARSAPHSRARSLALYHSHERAQLLEQGHARMRCARLHAADGPHALGSDAGMQQCGTGLAEVP